MASYISALREENATIFSLPNREKFHSAHSPYALNELNLALTQQILAEHEKN
jgi:hypothetical protein